MANTRMLGACLLAEKAVMADGDAARAAMPHVRVEDGVVAAVQAEQLAELRARGAGLAERVAFLFGEGAAADLRRRDDAPVENVRGVTRPAVTRERDERVRRRWAEGATQTEIAKEEGLSQGHVSRILSEGVSDVSTDTSS